jgi:hypothetical protein
MYVCTLSFTHLHIYTYTIENYKDVWKELPPDWLEGLDVKTQIASSKYDKSVNKYKGTHI